jgi:hypothetical protein
MKKTIPLRFLVDTVNQSLLNTADDMKEYRSGLIHLIETALLEANNYGGFRYLSDTDMESSAEGVTPGINENEEDVVAKFAYCDHTRVRYFLKDG